MKWIAKLNILQLNGIILVTKMIKTCFLLGLMGSGKTWWGTRLAERLNRSFVDLDEQIESGEGLSINEIFEQVGEPGFRQLERDYLQGLAAEPTLVVATGGCTPCFFDNLELMKRRGWVIYLETPLALLAKRLKKDRRARPLLETPDPDQVLANLLEARKKFYSRAQIIYQQRREGMNVAEELAGHLVNIGGH